MYVDRCRRMMVVYLATALGFTLTALLKLPLSPAHISSISSLSLFSLRFEWFLDLFNQLWLNCYDLINRSVQSFPSSFSTNQTTPLSNHASLCRTQTAVLQHHEGADDHVLQMLHRRNRQRWIHANSANSSCSSW